jgi:hypothetical protein
MMAGYTALAFVGGALRAAGRGRGRPRPRFVTASLNPLSAVRDYLKFWISIKSALLLTSRL